jgi:steroid delta-isomerase-like uncharacterized protein
MTKKHFTLIIAALLLFYMIIACQTEEQEAGTTEARPVVTKERAEEMINLWLMARHNHDLGLLDSIYTTEAAIHDPSADRDICGVAELKQYYERTHTIFPDVKFEFDEIRVAGDWIISTWTMQGTNTGPIGELPPTGKEIIVSGAAIDRIEDGMIVEEWVYWNPLELYQQLGFTLVPPQPETEEAE